MSWIDDEHADKWHWSHQVPLELPPRFQNPTPNDIPHEPLLEVARNYCRNFYEAASQGIAPTFLGQAQTWKTYTACMIGKWVWSVWHLDVVFVDCGQFLNALETDRFSPDAQRALERVKGIAFLILDDFTNVVPNTWAHRMLVDIATHRFNTLRPTVWTGNITDPHPIKKIGEVYGMSLARRVATGSTNYRCTLRV